MYIVWAVKNRVPYYYVKTDQGRRGYRWVAGDTGLRAAQRFRTEEGAAEVTLAHREYYGALARVVPDPLKPPRRTRVRRSGFVIRAVSAQRTSYIVLQEGVYRWRHGEGAEDAAFCFSSAEAAYKVIQAGRSGVGGGSAEIIQLTT